MTELLETIKHIKYAPTYTTFHQLKEKHYISVGIPAVNEKSLANSIYDIPYSEVKGSLVKDFEKKIERVHAKYEKLIIDTIFKELSNLDSDILELNHKLSKTINELAKPK